MGWADSAYTNDSSNWCSTYSMTIILDQAACICISTKQKTISTSIIETNYVVLCQAGKQLVWANQWFEQLPFRSDQHIELKRDN